MANNPSSDTVINRPQEIPLETWRAWDKAHLWHPFTPRSVWDASEPLVLVGGQGCEVEDWEGRRYLDGVSSLWCNVHGHRHPALDEAIRAQLGRVAHTTLLGTTHPCAIALAKQLAELAPGALNRVFFSDDGSTAVECALKIAFQYWRNLPVPQPARTLFLALGDAYHGDTLGDVSVGGIETFHAAFGPLLFPALRIPTPHVYRDPQRRSADDVRRASLDAAEALLQKHAGEIAGIVVEPLVQGAAGLIVHPKGFLRGLRDLADRYDTLLICDEVAVGFGRTGKMFACQHEDVVPDILCLAKGITGGYLPLAATIATERVYDAFLGTPDNLKTFYHGHTYTGNPLAAAAGLANLEIFASEQTLEQMPEKIARMADGLEKVRCLPHVGDIRQCGLMVGVELAADPITRASFPAAWRIGARVCQAARELGVLLRPLGDVIVLMPPLAIQPEQIDRLCAVLAQCISNLDPRPDAKTLAYLEQTPHAAVGSSVTPAAGA